nr:MAG TPA: NPR1/NIM1 like defence protein C terminal [Bacteriophage sp.]
MLYCLHIQSLYRVLYPTDLKVCMDLANIQS